MVGAIGEGEYLAAGEDARGVRRGNCDEEEREEEGDRG